MKLNMKKYKYLLLNFRGLCWESEESETDEKHQETEDAKENELQKLKNWKTTSDLSPIYNTSMTQ